MKQTAIIITFLVIAVGSFYFGRRSASYKDNAKRVLYYVDPMHPSYRSDRPGIAPDCGMALEAVYEGTALPQESLPPGAVPVSSDKQQLIGIRVEKVERTSGKRIVRTTGRVAIDENRLYRIVAGAEGWIRSLGANAAGTSVHKNEELATFYTQDFLRAQQSLFFALKTLDRVKSSGHDSDEQIKQAEEQVRTSEEALRSLGMGEPQLRELTRKRETTRDVAIASPDDGLVIARNLSPGQRLDRGTEIYRIANLEKVWILADIFPGTVPLPKAGATVRITVRELGKTLAARVSNSDPIFDPATRTLQYRLEADNPGSRLRPDMFVDVEFEVTNPPGLSVSTDAVVRSGSRQIAYVEVTDGVFVPREIEIGDMFDGRILVKEGLREGERVVTSGTFLIDSESRMRSPALVSVAKQEPTEPSPDNRDVVCGMSLNKSKAVGEGHFENHKGSTFVFCSDQCRRKFLDNPESYTTPHKRATVQTIVLNTRGD
jgi:RND family efflux transporter MFP subunit